jgi:hypothetical protein
LSFGVLSVGGNLRKSSGMCVVLGCMHGKCTCLLSCQGLRPLCIAAQRRAAATDLLAADNVAVQLQFMHSFQGWVQG